MGRYLVRVFADQEQNNATTPGTVVKPLDVQLSFYTDSADEAEKKLYTDILKDKLAKGRVYQICPSMGSFEPIRSCAIALDGSAQRVFLDPADGVYGTLRRIRLPRPKIAEDLPLKSSAELPSS